METENRRQNWKRKTVATCFSGLLYSWCQSHRLKWKMKLLWLAKFLVVSRVYNRSISIFFFRWLFENNFHRFFMPEHLVSKYCWHIVLYQKYFRCHTVWTGCFTLFPGNEIFSRRTWTSDFVRMVHPSPMKFLPR